MVNVNCLNILVVGATGLAFATTAAAQTDSAAPLKVTVSDNVHHDELQSFRAVAVRDSYTGIKPLRDIKRIPRLGGKQITAFDAALQGVPESAPRSSKAVIGLNFDGIGNGVFGFSVSSEPPDTSGAVGDTQYLQIVNSSIAVIDKKTGSLVLGAVATNSLFKGFGGGCETNNDGDGSVRWDNLAKRWVVTQFSISTTPYLECVAVSKTADATGGYNRYAFSSTNFPDYPKFGVWPDAYYFTFNDFVGGASFAGARICAYDRTKMLAGKPAKQQCFSLGTKYGGVLPADPDGSSTVPVGSPNYLLGLDGSNAKLDLWKFHVDFAKPVNTKLTGPIAISVTPFMPACAPFGNSCVPQLGATTRLDTLSDRLMFRLSYRLYPDGHEALLATHSVMAGASGGIRWYEIRSPSTTPTVFQQGTFAPDSIYRWLGSGAQDKLGEFAVGYSGSSTKLHPSVRFATRAPVDVAGKLTNEVIVYTGAGSENGSFTRWGDYSGMTVDATDDCTFWFTTEYEKVTGEFNWSTRIANFKIPSCK